MKHLTRAFVVLAAVAALLAAPRGAQAQVTTQEVSNCTDCYACEWLFPQTHDATGPSGRYAGLHYVCLDGTTCDGHPLCGIYGDASEAEQKADDRLKEILNTMEGEERIAALQEEFPDQLRQDGDALLIEGMLCEQGQVIGRLLLPQERAAQPITRMASLK